MTQKMEQTASQIREFFTHDSGKWEVDGDGLLWLMDANYGFDPTDLAAAILQPKENDNAFPCC